MCFFRKASVERRLRKSFQSFDVTIDVEKGYGGDGVIRLVERGRSYVKVLSLYEEELLWLQSMCWMERRKKGGYQQLGSLRGGHRTLICSRILADGVRKMELRLFAPYGKRQMCIPEISVGEGWTFFAELLEYFVRRKKVTQHAGEELFPWEERSRMNVDNVQKKSYLQVASRPGWQTTGVRSTLVEGKEKHMSINNEDAEGRISQMSRCLLGSLGGLEHCKEDLEAVRRWMESKWNVPGGVELKEIDSTSFLLIFPSKKLAEERIGKHHVLGEPLFLDSWHGWGSCNRRGWSPNYSWVRVVGLPYFLWDK